MEIVVKINNYDDVKQFNNADAYLLSNKFVSFRYSFSFSLNQIKKITKESHLNEKKVYILINKIFTNDHLIKLEAYIQNLISIGVDGFYFCDFAVFVIAKKYNFSDKCYFYHETFLRNTYDILTYQEMGINNIICSKDMHIDDINNLPIKNKEQYGIMVFGYVSLYESKRKIISNFIKQNNLDKNLVNSTNLSIKEETRNQHYKILQQNGITSIFDNNIWCYLDYSQQLAKHINIFIFDCLFLNSEYVSKVIDLFKKSLNEKISMNELLKLDNSLSFTEGFLTKRVGIEK